MVLIPENFCFSKDTFNFTLPKGAFATSVLRELLISNIPS
jgi:tRNA(Glu) U13 pseudouridine synthase TruD